MIRRGDLGGMRLSSREWSVEQRLAVCHQMCFFVSCRVAAETSR